jgi:hypothetical protein
MIRMRRRFASRLEMVVVLAVGMQAAGCATLIPPELRPGDDSLDEIHIAAYGSVAPGTRRVESLPRSAYRSRWFFDRQRGLPRRFPPADKVHPDLRAMMGVLPINTRVDVVVTFTDTVTIPRFPRPDYSASRDTSKNAQALDSAQAIVGTLRASRAASYSADTTALKTLPGVTILGTFWLLQACRVSLPLSEVTPASLLPEVVSIRLNTGRPAPHHDDGRSNDVDQGRAAIGSDPYDALPMKSGWIGLIDTGVRTTHRLLCDPSHLCMVADCVSGKGTDLSPKACSPFTSDCRTSGGGDTYKEGHGTGSAAILTANANYPGVGPAPTGYGPWFRGVTKATLDCFQVYGPDRKVRVDAVLRAFELAVARLDHVIVAEMQENSASGIGDVARAAEHAYATGAAVIAANGNGEAYGVGVPASARRVMGVGAYHLQFDSYVAGQARGPTTDGRIKPDIVAPSYTETAANADDSDMEYHGGTSGATPYAAGAASLVHDWMTTGVDEPDPGQIYAHLILSGDQVGPFPSDSHYGAGRLHLPPSGEARYGKVWVSDATQYVDIPIDLPVNGVSRLEAAIWWPESSVVVKGSEVDTHNDIDLEIHAPGLGGARATSNGANGVFERASVEGSPTLKGQWRVRVLPFTMRTGPQVVYWGASLIP